MQQVEIIQGIWSENPINKCYVAGTVNGNNNVGGLVGYIADMSGAIRNCYAIGHVEGGSGTGGLVGNLSRASVTASYCDSQTTGQSDTGKGGPRTTEQMVKGMADSVIDGVAIYTGWSTNIWDFGDDNDLLF